MIIRAMISHMTLITIIVVVAKLFWLLVTVLKYVDHCLERVVFSQKCVRQATRHIKIVLYTRLSFLLKSQIIDDWKLCLEGIIGRK